MDHYHQVYQVEFLILCIGQFSGIPDIPEFPPGNGPEVFDGKVMHSIDYAAMDNASTAESIKGKSCCCRKWAMDIAAECANANGVEFPCTLICRTPHWNVPDYFPWGVPLSLLYLNRFAELLYHKPGEGVLLALFATLLSPVNQVHIAAAILDTRTQLRWAFSKFVESYIRSKFPLKKYGMTPKHSFFQEISSCMTSVAPEDFYDKVRKGKHHLEEIAIIQECIHPRIPLLAVIGYTESLSNLYSFEMQCRWVAYFLEGGFKLPSIRNKEEDILK
ncbi:LOW QUALITY PROTEIN: Flavin monooxygenase-like protein [Cinnamomum micranthum f. kanehirae]|uniref:Flavin monooxygenase-like protein n=1 Tax=Cinnamomum micranthum f. kanehirae TaxID=337451 RepID=A0A443NJ08_9MAGN|nr:LOW QUALITY PROTEIN: Flavin monooxygenase-like protein [Cinnamomum micranthum f. kanehirae]